MIRINTDNYTVTANPWERIIEIRTAGEWALIGSIEIPRDKDIYKAIESAIQHFKDSDAEREAIMAEREKEKEAGMNINISFGKRKKETPPPPPTPPPHGRGHHGPPPPPPPRPHHKPPRPVRDEESNDE